MIPKNRRFIVQSYYHKSILFPSLVSVFLFAILLVFSFTEGHCAQVTLTWDPNSEPDLSGYEVYYGTSSGNYQWNMDVGNVTTYNVNSLDTGITYYFAATAYNTSGYESGYSNEVVYTPPSCTYSINPSSASFPASGGSGSVLVSTQAGCNWGTSAAPSWVTVNSGSGLGNGTMGYMVSPNTGTTRIASLTIAGNVFTMTETGQTPYTITASAGTGGIIFPSGGVSVQSGANQTFTITPNSGYAISSVLVDGVAKGAVSTYTFSAVNTNHTINATFTAIPNYTLTVIKNGTGSGTVSTNPTGTSFSAGTPVTLTATPDANSVFSGWSGGCTGTASTCQVTMNANVSVNATFTLKPYTITASAGTGGGISPLGVVSVQAGVNQTFTITPNSGYVISSVLVDSLSQGVISTYTFSAVNTNHTINATFTAISNYTLTVIKNGTGSGTVSTNPSGTSFSAGTPVTLTATPDANSVFSSWSGGCTGTASTCQVTMNANVSVNATFSAVTNMPTVATGTAALVPLSSSATLNGTVNPNGLPTTYIFQWGRSTSYGNTTAVTTAGSGTINTAASAKISGLRSYTVYYYRLVATNSAGTTFGGNMAFKTKFTGIRK
jgi:hypothetical protein